MTLRERALRKATRRLIPFLFLIYVVAYLDRVNVSFAQLQLEDDLGFSDTIFGLGAGIFSLGYVIFGVPSNLALERFGARRWLAGIMIVWGLAVRFDAVHRERRQLLRDALPARRGGGRLLPGDHPVPHLVVPRGRAHAVLALFLTAISVAYVVGGPLSGGLLDLMTARRPRGLAVAVPDRGAAGRGAGLRHAPLPRRAPRGRGWLEPEERELLAAEVARERELKEAVGVGSLGASLRNGQVWLLSLIYFLIVGAAFGLTFFVPDLVQDRTGYSDFEVGALAAVPYSVATVAMLVVARRADVAPSRRPYLIVAVLVGAAGCVLTAYAHSPVLLTVAITLSAVGLLSAIPVFWAFPTAFLTGSAAAAGIALIAAIGNLGGFAGPAFTGISEDQTGGFEMPLTVLAGTLVLGSALVLLARERGVPEPEPEPAAA